MIKIPKLKLKKLNFKKIDRNEVGEKIKKAVYSPYLYLFLGVMAGFLFTFQIRTESRRPLNPTLFYSQLEESKKSFEEKRNGLETQAKDLQKQIEEKERSLTEKNYVSQSFLNGLEEQENILGTNSLEGEGVSVSISDGDMQIKDELNKSLTHAADLRDIVNLLWYAGAEAISINNERFIYNTSIDCIVSTILINNNNYAPPFTIRAIGNQEDLFGVLNNSKKLESIKKRAEKKQINLEIKKEKNIRIEKYSGIISSN